jgi:hypothetical protein
MKFSRIAESTKKVQESAASKLGIPSSDYDAAKKSVDELIECLWKVEESIGPFERSKDVDIDVRTSILDTVARMINDATELKKVVEKGKFE